VAFGDKNLKVVSKFVYLGTWIWRYSEESKLQHLAHQTKLTIYKALIHPVLLYGSETWVLTKREENRLLFFKRKVLQINGLKIVDGGNSRSRYNVELNWEFYITNVIGGVVKSWTHDKRCRKADETKKKTMVRCVDGVNNDSRALEPETGQISLEIEYIGWIFSDRPSPNLGSTIFINISILIFFHS
jgi:hypothetical protein